MGYSSNYFVLENFRGAKVFHQCPHCKNETFRRYVYKATGVEVNYEVGICENEKKCGYWYSALDYLKDNNLLGTPLGISAGPSYISYNLVEKSFQGYDNNNFVKFLNSRFGNDMAFNLIKMYNVGTSRQKWEGASVFWQFDKNQNVRTGRYALINKDSGMMVNECIPLFGYVHRNLKNIKFNPIECLFGEHLLRSNHAKEVVVVKEETVAIMGAGLYPEYLWLSTCGHPSPTTEMCRALKGRKAIWYPEGDSVFNKLQVERK